MSWVAELKARWKETDAALKLVETKLQDLGLPEDKRQELVHEKFQLRESCNLMLKLALKLQEPPPAVARLQGQAVDAAEVAAFPSPARTPVATESDSQSGAAGGHENDLLPDTDGVTGARGVDASVASGEARPTGADRSQQSTRQAKTCTPAVRSPRTLKVHSKLMEGSEGSVMMGSFDGIAAVVKLLGPDEQSMSALYREVLVLHMLQSMAGQDVPQLLGTGCMGYAGVHFLATAFIEGQPLSRLQHVPEDVAAAATAVLDRIHEFDPRLLHGDVRLANIMLCKDTAPAKCMFLDFGRSSLAGDAAKQQAEKLTLKQLFQR